MNCAVTADCNRHEEPNEINEMWREYKKHKRGCRARDAANRSETILALRNSGYKVEMITATQFRINGTLDLYPVRGRWHNIKTQKRGSWDTSIIGDMDGKAIKQLVETVFEVKK